MKSKVHFFSRKTRFHSVLVKKKNVRKIVWTQHKLPLWKWDLHRESVTHQALFCRLQPGLFSLENHIFFCQKSDFFFQFVYDI